jgi:hypothetical protein
MDPLAPPLSLSLSLSRARALSLYLHRREVIRTIILLFLANTSLTYYTSLPYYSSCAAQVLKVSRAKQRRERPGSYSRSLLLL